jgi:high-affinity nickel-transport protein
MADVGLLALAGLGVSLGLRHGIDWDHIAAITDITGSVVTNEEANAAPIARTAGGGTLTAALATAGAGRSTTTAIPTTSASRATTAEAASAVAHTRRREARDGVFLATFYALGHASMVVLLGLLALWVSEILPDWLDPLMERVVGVTLLLLGLWIVYSLWRYGSNFRLQSRWMLVFALIGNGWRRLRGKEDAGHVHMVGQYGPRTAFGIGLLHGIGAETGSQALLLASVAGATTQWTGSYLLIFFTVGLLLSNTLVAALSAFGFVSAGTRRTVYLVIGVFAAIFSLVVGAYFATGNGDALPDLGRLLGSNLAP